MTLLSFGQLQLYLQTKVDSFEDIKIGFPFQYYSFSRDGNNFHEAYVDNFIYDYLIILTGWVILLYVMKKMNLFNAEKKTS